MSSNSSELLSIVRAHLETCDDEALKIAGNALCDSYEEMDKSMDIVERAINNMRREGN
jgi:hypothetical protein